MSLCLLVYYAKMTGTTLDMLVGDMIPEYREDALDHAIMEAVKDLTATQKEKMLMIGNSGLPAYSFRLHLSDYSGMNCV